MNLSFSIPDKKNSGLVPGVTGETDTAVDRAVGDSGSQLSLLFPFSLLSKPPIWPHWSNVANLHEIRPQIHNPTRIDFIHPFRSKSIHKKTGSLIFIHNAAGIGSSTDID
jgi:hypothetical protein